MMNFEKAYAQMVVEFVVTKFIAIRFRDKEFNYYSAKRRLRDHTCERYALIDTMKEMFEHLYRPNVLYRTTSIYFAELDITTHRQDSLFEFDDWRRQKEQDQRKILETIANINNKLGWTHITTWVNIDAIKKMDGSEFQKLKVS